MTREHTVSEVTNTDGMTDAQFFYSEIMEFQKKCYALEQKNKALAEELVKAQELVDSTRRTYARLSHIIYRLKSLRNISPKATKAEIIETVNLHIRAAEICDTEYNNGKYFTECLSIARKEIENGSTNS